MQQPIRDEQGVIPPHDPKEKISFAEFCRREYASEFKHEFNRGYAVPIQGPDAVERVGMAGARPEHNLTAANATREMGNAFKGSGCTVYTSDQMVYVQAVDRGFYPDVVVVCGEREMATDAPSPKHRQAVKNPAVLVEVLSDSAEVFDRGEKHFCYLQIPSLREYVLMHQDRPRVEVFAKNEAGQWEPHVYDGLDADVRLPSQDVTVPVADLYLGVDFDD